MKLPCRVNASGAAGSSGLLVLFRLLFLLVKFHLNWAFHVVAEFPALVLGETFRRHFSSTANPNPKLISIFIFVLLPDKYVFPEVLAFKGVKADEKSSHKRMYQQRRCLCTTEKWDDWAWCFC